MPNHSTVDLISYKITQLDPSPSVIEAAAGSGDLCGSTFLDREFATWLKKRFAHLSEWDDGHREDAMERWMDIKKGFDGKTDNSWTIRARGLPDNERLRIRNGTFKVTGSHVKQVFEPVIQNILALVQSQITESKKGDPNSVKAVLLAGGFGNNPYLKARIQESVGKSIMVDRMHDTYDQTSLCTHLEESGADIHLAKQRLSAELCSKGWLIPNQALDEPTSISSHERLAIILASLYWIHTTLPNMSLRGRGDYYLFYTK